MRIDEHGLALIKAFEGLKLNAYRCAAGVWTIGYGHTLGVNPGDTLTEQAADLFLRQDAAVAEASVNRYVNVPLTQNQFNALVSFVFNLGSGNFRNSTLLKKLNAGDYQGAGEELLRWVRAGDSTLPGLVRRRAVEKTLFENHT
jgi:lysozyme